MRKNTNRASFNGANALSEMLPDLRIQFYNSASRQKSMHAFLGCWHLNFAAFIEEEISSSINTILFILTLNMSRKSQVA